MQPLADLDDLKDVVRRLPLAAESLDSRGLYIYDDGFRLVLWFGRMLSPDIAKNLLGADFAAELSRVYSFNLTCILAYNELMNGHDMQFFFIYMLFFEVSAIW